MGERLIGWVLRHRLAVAIALVAVTAVLGVFATRVQFDNTIEGYFLEEDLNGYREFLDRFGSDEILAVAFQTDDAFSSKSLELIDALSRGLKAMPHVRRVLSPTTARIVFAEGEAVHFDPLAAHLPLTEAGRATACKRALADPIVPGTLISRDGRNAAVIAEIEHRVGEFDYKVALLERVRALIREQQERSGVTLHLAGAAVLDDAIFRYTQQDQQRFFPLLLLIIVGVMLVLFRRGAPVLLPLLVVALSASWSYGLLVLLGFRINVITTVLGPLLMSVAIADSMHVISDLVQQATRDGEGADRIACIRRSTGRLLEPCLLTSLTTVLGLLSLLVADLTPVRQFGLIAAAGVAFAFVITVLLLPVLLSLLPLRALRPRRARTGGATDRLLGWLGGWRPRRAAAVLAASAALAVLAGVSLPHLTVGTNSLDYFRADDPVRRQTEWIDAAIGGTTSLEFLVDGGAEDALKDPALLGKIDRFERYLRSIDGVTGAISVVELVEALHRAYRGDAAAERALPSSRAAVAQELLLLEGSDDLEALLTPDYAAARISARVEMRRSQALAHHMPEIEARIASIFGATRVTPTGLVYLMHRMEGYLLSSQIESFLLAFAVIGLAMIAMLRSLRLGLLAMVPNFLPILLTLGLMPLLSIPLDVGTVMIAGVALGLVVDDTIHLLSRLQQERRAGAAPREAMALAIRDAGRPIVHTSVVLSLAFLVLVLASFNPIIHFGILAAIVVVLALVSDLLVTPALVGLLAARGRRAGGAR